jgi:hypothetical protein
MYVIHDWDVMEEAVHANYGGGLPGLTSLTKGEKWIVNTNSEGASTSIPQ